MSQSLSKARNTHLGRMLLKLERLFTRQVLSELAKNGITDITLRHFVIIPHIDHDGIRAAQIARQTGISKQAVSKLVDELVKKEYLELKPDPEDGRALLIFMSKKGNAFLKLAIKYTQQVEEQWQRQVGESEFKNLKLAMTTLLNNQENIS